MNSRKLSIKTVYFIENERSAIFQSKLIFISMNEAHTYTHSWFQSAESTSSLLSFLIDLTNHTSKLKKKKKRRKDRQTIYQLISAAVFNVNIDWKNELKRSRAREREIEKEKSTSTFGFCTFHSDFMYFSVFYFSFKSRNLNDLYAQCFRWCFFFGSKHTKKQKQNTAVVVATTTTMANRTYGEHRKETKFCRCIFVDAIPWLLNKMESWKIFNFSLSLLLRSF